MYMYMYQVVQIGCGSRYDSDAKSSGSGEEDDSEEERMKEKSRKRKKDSSKTSRPAKRTKQVTLPWSWCTSMLCTHSSLVWLLIQETGRKKKAQKDPNAPKKPLSAYMLWLQENRPMIKKKYPGSSLGELGKRAGEMWNAMTDKTVSCVYMYIASGNRVMFSHYHAYIVYLCCVTDVCVKNIAVCHETVVCVTVSCDFHVCVMWLQCVMWFPCVCHVTAMCHVPFTLQEWEAKAKQARKNYEQLMAEYRASGKAPTASPAKYVCSISVNLLILWQKINTSMWDIFQYLHEHCIYVWRRWYHWTCIPQAFEKLCFKRWLEGRL